MNKQNEAEVERLESAARAAKARYQREWYARNKDRAKAYQTRYWAKAASKQGELENDNPQDE